MGRGIHLPLIAPEPSPAGPLKVCRERTITVSPEVGPKQWQALDYGSPEGQKVYFRLRNSVEGYNGYANGIDQSTPGHRSTTKTGPTREIAHASGPVGRPDQAV
ncbi:hypothetical protein [Streptomyces montanus]|uniref:hypothetical protein n=1 Tax=Streptomyces montanus TaxID=2580423 RepID=UPI001FE5C92D|nr:hypothetical protein [Streptomyces montanus]